MGSRVSQPRYFSFCSRVPAIMMGNDPSALAAIEVLTPAQAQAISSKIMQWDRHDRPRPPNSSGTSQFIRPRFQPSLRSSAGKWPSSSN